MGKGPDARITRHEVQGRTDPIVIVAGPSALSIRDVHGTSCRHCPIGKACQEVTGFCSCSLAVKCEWLGDGVLGAAALRLECLGDIGDVVRELRDDSLQLKLLLRHEVEDVLNGHVGLSRGLLWGRLLLLLLREVLTLSSHDVYVYGRDVEWRKVVIWGRGGYNGRRRTERSGFVIKRFEGYR